MASQFETRLFINNEVSVQNEESQWVSLKHPYFFQYVEAKSGQTLEIHNPTDGSLVASNIHVAGEADVDDAVTAATKAFKEGPWSHMNGAKRAGLLNKFADLFEKNIHEIVHLESLAMGIPVGSAKMFAHAIPAYFRCLSPSFRCGLDSIIH